MIPFIPLPATAGPAQGAVEADAPTDTGEGFAAVLTGSADKDTHPSDQNAAVEPVEEVLLASVEPDTETAEAVLPDAVAIDPDVRRPQTPDIPIKRTLAIPTETQIPVSSAPAEGATDDVATVVRSDTQIPRPKQVPVQTTGRVSVQNTTKIPDSASLPAVSPDTIAAPTRPLTAAITPTNTQAKAPVTGPDLELNAPKVPVAEKGPAVPLANASSAARTGPQHGPTAEQTVAKAGAPTDPLRPAQPITPSTAEIASQTPPPATSLTAKSLATDPFAPSQDPTKVAAEQGLFAGRTQSIEPTTRPTTAPRQLAQASAAYSITRDTPKVPTPAVPTTADATPIILPDAADPLTRFDPASLVQDRFASLQPTAPLPVQADQARQIAQQLASATPTTLPGTTEITLQPEELGRVRMTLTVQDGVMTLVIQADRADTSDLMRRHIDQLAQTYRQMGYDSLNFSFTGSAQRDQSGSDINATDQVPLGDDDGIDDAAPPLNNTPVGATGRLDLRI